MSLELPCLNKGVTLEHFQSSGNIPVVKEQLKTLQIEMQIKSAYSTHLLSLLMKNTENLLRKGLTVLKYT